MLRTFITTTLAVVATSLVVAAATDAPETKEVSLDSGVVEGVKEDLGNSHFFFSFRGIPFAAPPVGELRFKDPAPVVPWTGVRKGLTPPTCSQISMAAFLENKVETSGEEDCLYLHVYAPEYADNLAVMVYIHGGGFLLGDADNFGGTPRPLLTKNIILVSIQYRLGTLGFLSTEDSVLPGNLGLKDQSFALKWVQRNIHKFGGDSQKVTVFGESAGSASAHYHMITPYSEGLFQRAILQSGATICPWALREDHAKRALNAGKHFGCIGTEESSADSTKLLQCFMEQSAEELVLIALKDTLMYSLPFYMVPRVDGDYLPAHPAQLMKEGRQHKVDLISGICQNEAAGFPILFLKNETMKESFLKDFDKNGPLLLALDEEKDSKYLTYRAHYHYVGDIDISVETIDKLEKLYADVFMNNGHDETTALHAHNAQFGKRTYRYELQHRGEKSLIDIHMKNFTLDIANEWVSHGDDLMYVSDSVFGMPTGNRTNDVFLSNIMVSLWTNFAKTGNPTPDLELGFKWESMQSKDDFRYLSLIPAATMKEDNRAEVREFWRNMPTKLNKILFPNRFACAEDVCKC